MGEGAALAGFRSGGEPAVHNDRSPPSLARVRAAGHPRGGAADQPARAPGRASALPAQTTRLIGREREVAQVRALLARSEVRLVTLVGPPGIGKTRLALAVVEAFLDAFADGVARDAPSHHSDAAGITGLEP